MHSKEMRKEVKKAGDKEMEENPWKAFLCREKIPEDNCCAPSLRMSLASFH